jgi:hypothetical protein
LLLARTLASLVLRVRPELVFRKQLLSLFTARVYPMYHASRLPDFQTFD